MKQMDKTMQEKVLEKFDPEHINWEYISTEDKEFLDIKEKEIAEFLVENSKFDEYDEKKKNELFETVIGMWNAMRDRIRDAKCPYSLTGVEYNFLRSKIFGLKYDAETVFYGLSLKHSFFTEEKMAATYQSDKTITISENMLLYHLLTKADHNGLDNSSYYFASALKRSAEISKIYQHYDNSSKRLNKSIAEWNMGLSKEDMAQLQAGVKETLKEETVTESK